MLQTRMHLTPCKRIALTSATSFLTCWVLGWSSVAVADPIPGSIVKSGLSVGVEDFLQMPQTGSSPLARINFLREEPGGSDRLFINDLNGFLYTVDKTTRGVTTYIDFTATFTDLKTAPGLASGHVTFAFHPDYADNGKFFTVHTEFGSAAGTTPVLPPPLGIIEQHSALVEWTASDPTANVFSGTRREIMRVGTLGPFHPMGDLSFNPLSSPEDPDYGLLYLSIGDGNSFGRGEPGNLQRLDFYLGTILRIDPDPTGQPTVSSNGQYSIPSANPWASDGDPNTFGETYAYGFRNPHRISWDTDTDAMFATDIGEGTIEEVNIIDAMQNYGWSEREGTFLVGGDPLPEDDASFGYTYPAAQYDHEDGRAVSSGFVYRGSNLPGLQGMFVTGDIVSGRIFYANVDEMLAAHDGDPTTTATIHELQLVYGGVKQDLIEIVSDSIGQTANRTVLRLALDADGELYVMTKRDGYVRQMVWQLIVGDMDCDSDVDFDDIDAFVLGLNDPTAYENMFGVPPSLKGDTDGDGDLDFDDILGFVNALSGGSVVTPVPESATFLLFFTVLATMRFGFRTKR